MIGIVIPASSGETRLGSTLKYLRLRTPMPHKVVVCSRVGGEYERVCSIYNAELLVTRTSLGEAKNLGAARLFDSDVLVFMDAHVKVDQGWDVEIARILGDPSVGIVTLYTYLLEPDFETERRTQGGTGFMFSSEFKRVWTSPFPDLEIVNGAFMAFRKEAFWQLGGFINFHDEDIEYSIRSLRFGYRNICGNLNIKIGHVFKVSTPNPQALKFDPINDYQLGDLLTAYLHFPKNLYAEAKQKHSPEMALYIERNFEKLKNYIDTRRV